MQKSPSWKANPFSASQEISRILWNLIVYYHIHKCLPPVPILSQIDPGHTHTHTTSLRPVLILTSHLRLGLPSGHFPSGFPTKVPYTYTSTIPHTCYIPRPSHYSRIDHTNNIGWGEKIIKLLCMYFFPFPCHFVPLRLKYFPQHPILKHP